MKRETKKCLKCNHTYYLEYMVRRGDGYRSICKQCERKRIKKYLPRYKERKREKIKIFFKTEKGKEYKKKMNEKHGAKWYLTYKIKKANEIPNRL